MRWTFVGHASWCVTVERRVCLIDPVLATHYHAGVFEVVPRRTVDVTALDPELVVVTHRHPDHFDVPTLSRLARRPDGSPRAFATADPFVAKVAARLGFSPVRVWPVGEVVHWGALRLLPTPSDCPVQEWGLLVHDTRGGGTAWHQVDTEVGPAEGLGARMAGWLAAVGASRLDLAIVRWNPLLQSELATGGPLRFPRVAWAKELARAALVGADLLMPGACGNRFVGPAAWRNQAVYPCNEARWQHDLAAASPDQRTVVPAVGSRWEVTAKGVTAAGDCAHIVLQDPQPDPAEQTFDVAHAPPVTDPCEDRTATACEARWRAIECWVQDALVPALAGWSQDVVRELVVVGVDQTRRWAVRNGALLAQDAMPARGYDQRVVVAASCLAEVLAGEAPWGRALLGGWLRAVDRTLPRSGAGSAFFVYAALSYQASFERYVQGQLHRLGR